MASARRIWVDFKGHAPSRRHELTVPSDDADLYDAGLTSLITVNLLLAIEDHFDVEFPDELLSRRTFQSIDALSEAVEGLV